MESYHKPPMDYLRKEAAGLRQRMLKKLIIEKWSEDMDYAITPVLVFLEENMRNLEFLAGGGPRNQMGSNGEINMLENKWDAQLREVADRVDGMAVFSGGRWFIPQL